jgi:hypothetical protein
MPSPKAFLRQIAQFNLDPRKPYTKKDEGSDGHIRNRVPIPDVKKKIEESDLSNDEVSKKKSVEVTESASTASGTPKNDKSVKPVSKKSDKEVKKVETTSQVVGVKASDESTVEPKENLAGEKSNDTEDKSSDVKPA